MSTPYFDITNFRNIFQTAARTYLFYVSPSIPGALSNLQKVTYLVRASSLPSSSFEEILTSMQQSDFKSAGKRTYDNWNVTFYIDINATIRRDFARWLNMIVDPISGIHGYPRDYMRDQRVTLLGMNKKEIMQFTLKNAYPTSVGETALDYGNIEYASFEVAFAYQYYIVR
jgi:hypothetical protein